MRGGLFLVCMHLLLLSNDSESVFGGNHLVNSVVTAMKTNTPFRFQDSFDCQNLYIYVLSVNHDKQAYNSI